MKIKSDFVTNSSSTCFVVSIPDDFYVNEAQIQALCNKYTIKFKDDASKNEFINITIPECIETLKEGTPIDFDEFNDSNAFFMFSEFLDKNDLILLHIDLPVSNDHSINPISFDRLENMVLNNFDITSISQQLLRKECEHVNTKTEK